MQREITLAGLYFTDAVVMVEIGLEGMNVIHQKYSTSVCWWGHGTFTMIMAGSGLPWLQTRSVRSSDALNHHCLLRLQLTLLTGLSCPAYKDSGLELTRSYNV